MLDTAITLTQLFFIGFTLTLTGPCTISCLPYTFPYILEDTNFKSKSINILSLLIGRFSAYLILGYLASVSGVLLRNSILNPSAIKLFNTFAAVIVIFLGIMILLNQTNKLSICKFIKFKKVSGIFSAFVLGLIVGVSPCAPLLTLLFEIALISQKPIHGLIYAASFGFGTLVSGLIVFGVIISTIKFISNKIIYSNRIGFVLRLIGGLLIIGFGVFILAR